MIGKQKIADFLRDEDGAATVDMVVMTAAGVATAVSLSDYVRDMMSDLVEEVGIAASAVNVSTSFGSDAATNGSGDSGETQ